MVTWEDSDDGMGSISEVGVTFDDNEIANMTPETNKAESLYGGSTVKGSSDNGDCSSDGGIGGRETVQVTYLRALVVMVLFLAAAAVSTVVFLVTKRAQEDDFETKYDGVSAKVLETFESIVSEKLAALSSFSVSTTAYARSHGDIFPYVTMNDYQQRAGSIREVVGCLLVYSIYQVVEEERSKWENYTVNNREWYFEDLTYQKENGINIGEYPFSPVIFRYDETLQPVYENLPGPYAAIWQSSPLFPSFPNFNVATFPPYGPAVNTAIATGNMAIGGILTAPPGDMTSPDLSTILYSVLLSAKEGHDVAYNGDPMAYVALPIFDSFDNEEDRTVVGTVSAIMNWAVYFQGIVPPRSKPVTIVLENACDGPYTYEADNTDVVFRGKGDLHDPEYNHLERRANLNALVSKTTRERVYNVFELEELGCPYSIRVFPTKAMEEDSETAIPFITTFAVAGVFVFTAFVFWIYNRLVEHRQSIVLSQATQSTALVSSFLPQEVQNRLLKDDGHTGDKHISNISRLKSFLSEGNDKETKPIADLFPFCSVLFADVAGFTAWSSTREPAQVFVLLQTLYQAFDLIAKKHKVFKVETIGDSYVAVTGVPTDQPMHAILMARFAWDILLKMNSLVKELERTLGPDTADLAMRIGIHSGPCTAGVLRGDRPRFQLFGDTVNTAARMESTGMRNRIQVSHTTAAEIEKLGKGRWLNKRQDVVIAKGKGALETYWLVPASRPGSVRSGQGSDKDTSSSGEEKLTILKPANNVKQSHEKQSRLVDWCVEVLFDKLREIQALRQGLFLAQAVSENELVYKPEEGRTCLDEVQEVMTLPPYDPKAASVLASMDNSTVDINPLVEEQLRHFVTVLAGAYRSNPFHNFEHACHVTMSVDKFLKRIVSPNVDGDLKTLHEYTHGLTSDPLLLMAIILSAVIHDIDHEGCSNVQLAKEKPEMADLYKNKSIAEQNSLDIAWEILMGSDFGLLRQAMFVNRSEMLRFRQVVVNLVLATDIFDKELNDLRKSRWERAFSDGPCDNNLRATIVMEHIIQGSDVSHTMQHWNIYRKWNERLFLEMSEAFRQGRMGKDPREFWYQGELGFFDNYIIPLAKKLKECNVFGVSSDECLNYAIQNRREWEHRGKEIVEELVLKVDSDIS